MRPSPPSVRRSTRGSPTPKPSRRPTTAERPADDPLERLLAGNRRFVSGTSRNSPGGAAWSRALAAGQRPFAAILGCSDSRVPVELVLDQGFGDLFVVRVAGNVVAEHVRASLEFAVHYLGTSLVVVLGHEECGAVTAALRPGAGRAREPEGIRALLSLIVPALRGVDRGAGPADRVSRGVESNVRLSVRRLRKLAPARVVGAVYCLETGRVRLLETGR